MYLPTYRRKKIDNFYSRCVNSPIHTKYFSCFHIEFKNPFSLHMSYVTGTTLYRVSRSLYIQSNIIIMIIIIEQDTCYKPI